jgi:hypothetical protein
MDATVPAMPADILLCDTKTAKSIYGIVVRRGIRGPIAGFVKKYFCMPVHVSACKCTHAYAIARCVSKTCARFCRPQSLCVAHDMGRKSKAASGMRRRIQSALTCPLSRFHTRALCVSASLRCVPGQEPKLHRFYTFGPTTRPKVACLFTGFSRWPPPNLCWLCCLLFKTPRRSHRHHQRLSNRQACAAFITYAHMPPARARPE